MIVVLPTGKTFPAGTPLRTIVTGPALSVAVAVPSCASVITTDDCVAAIVTVMLAGTVSTGRSVSATVIFCVFTVLLPKMSVAVQVMVVVPIGKTLPAGTPDRTTDATATLSVAEAVPIALSLMSAVFLPGSVERLTSPGTVSVGGVGSTALMTRVPTCRRVLSNETVPLLTSRPSEPSTTLP